MAQYHTPYCGPTEADKPYTRSRKDRTPGTRAYADDDVTSAELPAPGVHSFEVTRGRQKEVLPVAEFHGVLRQYAVSYTHLTLPTNSRV